jgi:hypothetical protein
MTQQTLLNLGFEQIPDQKVPMWKLVIENYTQKVHYPQNIKTYKAVVMLENANNEGSFHLILQYGKGEDRDNDVVIPVTHNLDSPLELKGFINLLSK